MPDDLPEEAGGPAVWQRDPRVAIDQLFLSEKYKIGSLTITRCGSAFVKNFLFWLDHEEPHPGALNIHDYNDELPRGDTLTDGQAEDYLNFIIVRNPVDRFLALYFGRILGRERPKFKWLLDAIEQDGGPTEHPISLEEHRAYCKFLIGWIERTFHGEVDQKPNALWLPQRLRVNTARAITAKILTLDGLNDQLFVLLGARIENVRAQMARTPRARPQDRLFPKNELLTKDILDDINRVYAHDRHIWLSARNAWSDVDMGFADEDEVPQLASKLT